MIVNLEDKGLNLVQDVSKYESIKSGWYDFLNKNAGAK